MSARRLKIRRGARIIVLADDRVLLQRDTDPGIPGSAWWVTPGGGVDDGESQHSAALRELYEETGLALAAEELLGPVATRVAVHGYSDRVLVQDEVFYLARVEHFDAVPAGMTATEKKRMTGLEWFALDALPQPLWPAQLGALATAAEGPVRDLGVVEESTVPLEVSEWRVVADYLDSR